jgi:hypothetical protein
MLAVAVTERVASAVGVIERVGLIIVGEGLATWVAWALEVAVADCAKLCGEHPASGMRVRARSASMAAAPRPPTRLHPRSIILRIKLLYLLLYRKRVYHTIVSCRAVQGQASRE